MNSTKQIFIVGSSRSGTTMVGRILARNKDIFTFNELHFFGSIWTNQSPKFISQKTQVKLFSKLLCIQDNGFLNQDNIADFIPDARRILKNKNLNLLELYEFFLQYISSKNHALISCDHTPKNIYYLKEILNYFPNAKVINMVRDQRDVLLSQKNKWRRRFLGASDIPYSEMIRSFINYNPILTSIVWKSSLKHSLEFKNNSRVKMIRFEDLLTDSERIVKDICFFLEINFQKEMLEIPLIGSSSDNDQRTNLQIDMSKIERWKRGGLSNAELYISQIITKDIMLKFGYKIQEFSFSPIVILYTFIFPFKLLLAFLLNIHRMGNILEVIKKRFF